MHLDAISHETRLFRTVSGQRLTLKEDANLRPSGYESEASCQTAPPRVVGKRSHEGAWMIRRGAFYPSLPAANSAIVGSTRFSKSA